MKKAEQKLWIKLLEFIGVSVLTYFIGNLLLNYLILWASYYQKSIKTGITLSEHLKFKIDYLLYSIPSLDFKIMIVLSLAVGFFALYKFEQMYKIHYGNKYIKGDDHFMTVKELKADPTLYSFDVKKPEEAEKSGLPIALENGMMYITPEPAHSLVVGTTRSGKGQTYVLPMMRYIALSKAKHSMVANDPKGELLENLYDTLIKNGYKVYVLNLRDTNQSSLWNPMQIIIDEYVKAMKTDGDLSKTIKLVTSLAAMFTDNPKSDPIWPDSARALLIAMILYLLEKGYEDGEIEKVTLYSVYNFFIEFGTKDEVRIKNGAKQMVNMLDSVFQNLPVGNNAKSAYATSNFAKGEMRSSIFSTLSSNINIFGTDTGISKLTSGNQIDFLDLINPDRPCAVFMVVPDEDVSRHIISSLFVNQCYNSLVEASSGFPMQKLPQRVHFILDEFGNMPRIASMDTKITVGAGRNLLFNLFVQDLNQLDTKYDNASKTIRSNCGNFVYINSLDKDTNEYVSAILGNETVEYDTYSGQLNEWLKNRSVNLDGRPLMTATQLGRMRFGETVIKRQRSDPIFTRFKPFYLLKQPITPINNIPIELKHRDLSEIIYNYNSIWYTIQKKVSDNGTLMSLSPEEFETYLQEVEAIKHLQLELEHPTESEAEGKIEDKPINQDINDDEIVDEDDVLFDNPEVKRVCKLIEDKCPEFREAMLNKNYDLAKALVEKQKRVRKISSEDAEMLLAVISQYAT